MSQQIAVPVFTGILVLIAVIIGWIIGRRRRNNIMKRSMADTTDQQLVNILRELFPTDKSFKGAPITLGFTSGQLAAGYGKDFAKSVGLSLLTGRKVHVHSDYSGDDNYILAYNEKDIYVVSILKNYKEMKIYINQQAEPLKLGIENVEKVKYKSLSGETQIVLKNKEGKFSITPASQFFDKLDQVRKEECKQALIQFSKQF